MDIQVDGGGNESDSSIPRMPRLDEAGTEVVEKQEEEGPVTFGAIRNLLKEELSTVKDSVKQISQDLGIFKLKMN